MCAQCDEAVVNYGLGSQLSLTIAEFLHPPTREEIEARERALAGLVGFLNACDDAERDREFAE